MSIAYLLPFAIIAAAACGDDGGAPDGGTGATGPSIIAPTARVIVPSFWRYTVANLLVTLLSTLTIWLMVDYIGLSGGLSTAISLGFFFVLRYAVLYRSNVIRREGHH